MNTNLNMQTMPIDRLKPAKYNPRKDLNPGDPAYEKMMCGDSTSPEAVDALMDGMPSLKAMYSADDENTQVLYFKNAMATFSSFTEAPETFRF